MSNTTILKKPDANIVTGFLKRATELLDRDYRPQSKESAKVSTTPIGDTLAPTPEPVLLRGQYDLYTDGSGSIMGPYGWAWILVDSAGNEVVRGDGYDADGTSNVAELRAVLEGLKAVVAMDGDYTVNIKSDSAYVVNCFTQGWHENWAANGWRTSTNRPVKNISIWQQLIPLAVGINATFEHVPGHRGIKYNEECDKMAGAARRRGSGCRI